MSDCKCDNTSTTSTTPPCEPFDPPLNCSRIRMFFGYDVGPASSTKIQPGQLASLYYTPDLSNDTNNLHIKRGFIIPNYSAQELVDSGTLPKHFGKKISEERSNCFDLSEMELLSTASWESWIAFNTNFLDAIPKNAIDNNNTSEFRTFGFWVLRSLGFDLQKMRADGFKWFNSLKNGDPSGWVSSVLGDVISAVQTSSSQIDPRPAYQSSITVNDCKDLIKSLSVEKLILSYEWLKGIYDTYYGKQFLVRIGDPVPRSSGTASYPLDTICIKDDNGEYPTLNYPYFIDGDGSAQGYYLSDSISTDGGFPDKNDTEILGLYNLDWIQSESGKIGSFVRVGTYAKSVEPTGSGICDGVYRDILYPKFQEAGPSGTCVGWRMDLSKLNTDNFYLGEAAQQSYYQHLYLACSVTERFYVDSFGTWVHFTCDQIPMRPRSQGSAQGFVYFSKLTNSLPLLLNNPNSDFSPAAININNGLNQGATDLYNQDSIYPDGDIIHGARPDNTLLNLTQSNPWSLIPEAVAIPFKSNLYRYGPIYYGDNNAGGVDVVNDEDMAPWNFIKTTSGSLPVDYTYTEMEKYAKDVASGSPRNLQKLEKGKITVAGLPCYCLGYWVDNKECYDENKEVGPTLLTDMSVEFGSGGFNTTYNFSTYTPRFGKPEKYITDAWKKSIRDTQYLNKYLKSLQQQVDRNIDSRKLRMINGNRTSAQEKGAYLDSPKFAKNSTTHQLMFCGYRFLINPTPSPDFDNYEDVEVYNSLESGCEPSGSIDDKCGKYVCTSPTWSTPTPPYYTPPPNRLYTFAETDKNYSIAYIQNLYYQLSGMSLDGFYLPVSLRGANKSPKTKEYQKDSETNRYTLSNNKLVPNPEWINHGRVPRFAKRCENNGDFIEWDAIASTGVEPFDRSKSHDPGMPISSKTRDEIPPFSLINTDKKYCYNLAINQRYLNPMLSEKNLLGNVADKVASWDDRKNESDKGFVISSIVFGQDAIDYQITHTDQNNIVSNTIEDKDTDEFIRQQFKNFRFPAMRGPLVLQAWGYDTAGKPIPNSSDGWGHAQMGEFRKDALTDKFMKNWLQYPKTWPVGPVDLRFDRERGVWTCPSPNKIVVARLKERLLPNNSAKAELINPVANGIKFYQNYQISGPNGENIKLDLAATEITVYDFLGVEYCACDIIYAYYDDNRYIVLESNRSYKDPDSVHTCEGIQCTNTTTTTTTTTPPCSWYGHDSLKYVSNYDSSKKQILGHDKGCLLWIDTTEC